ncbi:DUF2479 domain-containing protein [Lacticaseibacillus paracasei]|uniref:SGNH/GDSL hydrolase family protein n=1 Tax=Lacticaseibacillus paracasei TaxID=1597 RepID=UPI0010AEC833|nr:SGNH/GDSL hydrolase family protein [Lacticaseibacillus paracasei]TJY24757.1 DUF2479 domain-containing protein [Lacticaseibacillus paracasei]
MAIRTYKVTLDSKNVIAPEPVYLRQGDKTGSVVIDATLMDNGSPVSLNGLTPMFRANTADGKAVIADSTGFNIVDSSGGEFTYQVPNALAAVPGKITTAYFSFSDTSGSQSTFDVAFIIKKAIDITKPQADDYITIIDGTLDLLHDKMQSLQIDLNTIINNYNTGNFYNKSETDSKDSATLSSAKSYTDNSLKDISSVPETFTNLAAIQAKYPNGANGVMVAADNGHKYIWANNVWTDAGVYQSVGIADGSISPSQVKYIGADQVSLNEITDINPIPFQDNSKALSMSFNPVTGYFSATTATTQPNSGICFKAKRKAGSYTIDFRGVNSNMSGQGVYLSDANGNLKMKWGVYFANSSNESQRLQLGSNVFDLYGIKVGDTFQIVIAIGSSEAGGKTINGYIQLSNNAYPKRDTSLSTEIDNINVDLKQHLYRQNAVIDTSMTRWFSDANYTTNDDGSITYWRNGQNNPGPYFLLTQPVITGETVYVCFEAKKITGELTGVEIQLCNNNVFSNPSLGFRLADTVAVRLSNKFEQYIVPIVLDPKWSQQDPSTAGVLISISSSVDQAKVMIRNVAIIHAGSDDIDLGLKTAQSAKAEEAILPELSSGRRKGELLNLDVSESPLPKVHYVSPKSVVSSDNMYLDSLTVHLKTAETVKFAIGSVDQNSLMIKSSDFTLSLPAGKRTIVFKEDIAIPAGSRLFMECHNQGVLYQSDTSTEKILVEDEDHKINANGYSGYALYESTLMSPFSYRVRGQSVAAIANEAKTSSDDSAATLDDLKKSANVLTSPKGKKFAISVSDDGSISAISLTPTKAIFYGNSLTVGFDNYGMAASDYQHGWADLVSQSIKNVNSSFTYQSINGGNWENAITSANRIAELNNTVKPNIDASVDLVVIQLSDNVNTDDKKATFADDAKAIITWFRQQAPKARIVWIASWFNPPLIPDIAEACKERGALLCDIEQYARPQQYKSYVGAVWTDRKGVKHTIDNAGQAAHPGDLGMQMIANSVINTLGIG